MFLWILIFLFLNITLFSNCMFAKLFLLAANCFLKPETWVMPISKLNCYFMFATFKITFSNYQCQYAFILCSSLENAVICRFIIPGCHIFCRFFNIYIYSFGDQDMVVNFIVYFVDSAFCHEVCFVMLFGKISMLELLTMY